MDRDKKALALGKLQHSLVGCNIVTAFRSKPNIDEVVHSQITWWCSVCGCSGITHIPFIWQMSLLAVSCSVIWASAEPFSTGRAYAAPRAKRLPQASIWDPAGKLNLQAAAGWGSYRDLLYWNRKTGLFTVFTQKKRRVWDAECGWCWGHQMSMLQYSNPKHTVSFRVGSKPEPYLKILIMGQFDMHLLLTIYFKGHFVYYLLIFHIFPNISWILLWNKLTKTLQFTES